jgi:cyclopropane fatty-acyl-phospholipid synthase-like methyltransferase
MWNSFEEQFDVIIDDGLHEFWANQIFLENSLHKLKPGGYYIVEDIRTCDFRKFNNSLSKWSVEYQLTEIKIHQLPNPRNTWDNNLLVIKK